MLDAQFVCQGIAAKMRDPSILNFKKLDASLSQGTTGIALFYSLMHQAFPRDGWDLYAENYLSLSLERFRENRLVQCSLMEGFSGLGFVLNTLGDGHKTKKLQEQVDEALFISVRRAYLDVGHRYLNDSTIVHPGYYNIDIGLSGIILYLISKKNSADAWQLLKESLELLAKVLLVKKRVNVKTYPAWYMSAELINFEHKDPYFEGGFNVSMPSGISGALIALSLGVKAGVKSDLVLKCIDDISSWMMQAFTAVLNTGYWNSILSSDGSMPVLPPQFDLLRQTWAGGWPSVLKGMNHAASVSDNSLLRSFAGDLCKTLLKDAKILKKGALTLSIGMAGFLCSAHRLTNENNDSTLLNTTVEFKNEIVRAYDPYLPLGFQQCLMDEFGNIQWQDVPGLLHGVSGIGVALLLVQNKIKDLDFL